MHEIVCAMNEIAGSNGYGRIDMVAETGSSASRAASATRSRAPWLLIAAHKALKDLTLEKSVLHYKLNIEQSWADCVYNGLWFSPLKAALAALLQSTQQCVTGTVKLKFYKGSCTVVGRKSDYSLYDYELVTYDADDQFDHQAAKGFIDLFGLTCKVWSKNRHKMAVDLPQFKPVDSTDDGSRPRALRPPNRSARL